MTGGQRLDLDTNTPPIQIVLSGRPTSPRPHSQHVTPFQSICEKWLLHTEEKDWGNPRHTDRASEDHLPHLGTTFLFSDSAVIHQQAEGALQASLHFPSSILRSQPRSAE